jgi:hypothetical protein
MIAGLQRKGIIMTYSCPAAAVRRTWLGYRQGINLLNWIQSQGYISGPAGAFELHIFMKSESSKSDERLITG